MRTACRAYSLLPPDAQQFCLSRELTEEGVAHGPHVELSDGGLRLAPNSLRERIKSSGPVRGRLIVAFDSAGRPVLGEEIAWTATSVHHRAEEIDALAGLLALLELHRSLDQLPLWEDLFETSRDLELLLRKSRRAGRGPAAEAELRAAQDRLVRQLPSALQSIARTIRPGGRPKLSPVREFVVQHMIDLRFSSALIEDRLKLNARRVQELRTRGRRFVPATIEAMPRSLDEAGPWLEERINLLLSQLSREPEERGTGRADGKNEPQRPRLRG